MCLEAKLAGNVVKGHAMPVFKYGILEGCSQPCYKYYPSWPSKK